MSAYVERAHPDTSTVFVCGLLSFVGGPVVAIGTWYFGGRLLAKYDAEPTRWGHRDLVVMGRWVGVIGACISTLALAIALAVR